VIGTLIGAKAWMRRNNKPQMELISAFVEGTRIKTGLVRKRCGGGVTMIPLKNVALWKWVKKLQRLDTQGVRKDAIVSLYELAAEANLYSVPWHAVNYHRRKPDGIPF